MRSLEQYDQICKCFAEGKQRNANANEVQKQLQLHDLSVGHYLGYNYTLWIDFRMILHWMGCGIGRTGEGITLQIEKKAETAVEVQWEFLCPVEPLYFSDEKSITVEKG